MHLFKSTSNGSKSMQTTLFSQKLAQNTLSKNYKLQKRMWKYKLFWFDGRSKTKLQRHSLMSQYHIF